MAAHSSTVAWTIPWMEEPGGLQSVWSLRVRHNWAASLLLFTFMHWRREWQPTPVFLPAESQDGGAWWAAIYGVAQSRTWLKWLSSSSRDFVGLPWWLRRWRIHLQCGRPGLESQGWEDPLEDMATYSRILAWRIPGTEDWTTEHSTGLCFLSFFFFFLLES